MELDNVKIQQNYNKIFEDIKKYSPYPEKVKILFVSKYFDVEKHKAIIDMGMIILVKIGLSFIEIS